MELCPLIVYHVMEQLILFIFLLIVLVLTYAQTNIMHKLTNAYR
jgi:hypothetical protein